MQVIDRASGRSIEVPDEVVQAGFQSGKYALPKGARIPIQRADGDIGTVSPETLNLELSNGAAIMPQKEFETAQAQQQYGGLGGMAVTGGLGLVSGATGGLSDVAAAHMGEGVRKYVQGHYQANPTTKTVAQVAGALAPALVGDEEGIAGTAAGLAREANVAREGAVVARGVEGGTELAPEARALLGGAPATDIATLEAASRAEPGIAGRVLQGGYNAVTYPTHLTSKVGQLVDHYAGAILGDNSPSLLARTAREVIGKGGAGAAEGALYGLGNELSEESLGGEELNGQKLLAAVGHNALFGTILGGGIGGGLELGKAGFSRIARSDALGKVMDSMGWRALSPNKALTREAEKYVEGGSNGIGRQLVTDGVLEPGDSIEQIAPKVTAKKEEVFKELEDFHNKLSDSGAQGVKFDTLEKAIEKDIPDIVKKLGESSPLKTEIGRKMEQLATLVDEHGRIPLKDLNAFRKQILDDEIKWNQGIPVSGGGPTPTTKVLQSIRANVEDAFTKQADHEAVRLSGKVPGVTTAEYKALKLKAQRYIVADKAAQQGLAAKKANRVLSLTDNMAGFGVGGAGLAGAIASGGASIPAHVAHAAMGAAAAYGHKVVRERGNATVAALLHKARDLGAIAQVAKRFDGRLTKEVTKALHGQPYRGGAKGVDLDDYDEIAARTRVAQSKIAHDMAVDNHLGTINDHAPKTAAAFGSAVRRATNVLASKLPQQTYHPMAQEPPPTDEQKSELVRAARIVEDPLSLLKDIRNGTATAEDVQTLKRVHPDIYTQIQTEITKQVKTDKTIPYGNKLAMMRLMGVDLDGSYNPQTVQMLQMSFTPKPQKAPGAPKHRKAALKSGTMAGMTLNSRSTSAQYSHI